MEWGVLVKEARTPTLALPCRPLWSLSVYTVLLRGLWTHKVARPKWAVLRGRKQMVPLSREWKCDTHRTNFSSYPMCTCSPRGPWGSPGGTSSKEPTCQCRRHKRLRLDPWVRKIPWRRKWQPTPVFFPGESCGQRILGGYSPWGQKESDMIVDWAQIQEDCK